LTGTYETNHIRSEVPRRLRLHRMAETLITMQNGKAVKSASQNSGTAQYMYIEIINGNYGYFVMCGRNMKEVSLQAKFSVL